MKKTVLTGIAALLLATGTAHAYDPDLRVTPWEYCSANLPITMLLGGIGWVALTVGVIILILWLCIGKRGYP
jgi:hypothetical protein